MISLLFGRKIVSLQMNFTHRSMKRALLYLGILLSSLLAVAETYWTPDNLPMPYLQDRTQYVSNPDGILEPATVDSLNRELRHLENDLGVQTVVAVVEHIEGDDPYQFGQALADKYGIGREKEDDGLIVMLCTKDRSYSILTGKGLEGALPDNICRRIQDRVMIPLLREEAWDDAMLATLKAIDGYIRGDETLKKAFDGEDDTFEALIALFMTFGGFGIFMALAYYFSRKVCPQCGKRKMKAISILKIRKDGRRMYKITYRCTNCQHEEVRYEEDSNIGTGMGSGTIIGGGFGGRGGFGSGPIGGHFGGGSFGGGGSTGRF